MPEKIDLNERLARYGVTAKAQIAQGRSVGEVAGYAAAVGAGLAMAGTADASIVYSGVQNITAQINPAAPATTTSFAQSATKSFNVGGSVFKAEADFAGYARSGGAVAKYIGGASLLAPVGARFLGTSTLRPFGASFLTASAADIGPGGQFSAAIAARVRRNLIIGSGSANLTYGNFPLGVTGIVGVQLGNGDFGWIRLELDNLGLNQPFSALLGGSPVGDGQNYADKITIIDWAYEDSGAAIHAGSIPEPSSLALLAAGALGLGAFRRRKAQQAAH